MSVKVGCLMDGCRIDKACNYCKMINDLILEFRNSDLCLKTNVDFEKVITIELLTIHHST